MPFGGNPYKCPVRRGRGTASTPYRRLSEVVSVDFVTFYKPFLGTDPACCAKIRDERAAYRLSSESTNPPATIFLRLV
jgi:hypothetical protein